MRASPRGGAGRSRQVPEKGGKRLPEGTFATQKVRKTPIEQPESMGGLARPQDQASYRHTRDKGCSLPEAGQEESCLWRLHLHR